VFSVQQIYNRTKHNSERPMQRMFNLMLARPVL